MGLHNGHSLLATTMTRRLAFWLAFACLAAAVVTMEYWF